MLEIAHEKFNITLQKCHADRDGKKRNTMVKICVNIKKNVRNM